MKKIDRDIVSEIEKRNYLGNDEILLLIGARQAGKTTILKLLRDKVAAGGASNFFLNLEDPDYLCLLNQDPPRTSFKFFPLILGRGARFLLTVEFRNGEVVR